MNTPHFQSEKTKKEAYRLVHDPTRLFSLLYLKYGDIEEDYNIFYANQVIYNELSHFNSLYKDYFLYNSSEEFMKRFYILIEIQKRMPKLNDYYKNYFKFFSKPMLLNSFYNKLLNNYFDNKAEVFYNNNLTQKKISKDIKKSKKKKNNFYQESSLSSLDNDTENDIIFNKRIKNMIDNNLNTNSYTITLDINTKNDLKYINKDNISNSFKSIVKNIVNYKEKPKNTKDKNIMTDIKIYKKINLKHEIIHDDKENEKYKIIGEKITKENNNLIHNKFKIDSKNNEKEKNLIIHIEKINKNKQQKIKCLLNNKNINENNNIKKFQEISHINFTNQIQTIKFINPKNLIFSPLNEKQHIFQDKRKISKKIFDKKNLCLGINLNAYKSPLNKIKPINFYSPQNSKQKNNTFNKLFISLNYNKYKMNKPQHNSVISDNLMNRGFISINIENTGKRINNKNYKLMSRNLKNSNQNIKINNINSTQSKLDKISIKNFQTSQIKKNKSTQISKNINYVTSKDLNHNLSMEKNLQINGNGNLALSDIFSKNNKNNKVFNSQNNFLKQLSPTFSRNKEGKNRYNHDTNQKFCVINALSNIFENNFSNYEQNQYLIDDINKKGSNIKRKKLFYPINFKKSFNKKEIVYEKDNNLGLNLI